MMLQYNELAADLQRIHRFLASSSEEQQTTDQRRFGYIACISALYSSFENFVERVAFRFSELLLANPANLSADEMRALRTRYVRNASALLATNLGTGRYREVTELDVAKSLASCLDDSTPSFELRLELIALHNSNLRWESFAELFLWAAPGLHGQLQRSDAVRKWALLTDDVSQRTLNDVLKGELNDLVERRNEVAHRAIPDDILSYERLLAKVDYVSAISLGLVACLASRLLRASIKNGECVSLGVPSEYFKGERVVVISSLESTVKVGDSVLAPGGNSMRWGRVLEVQLGGQPAESAEVGMEVGLLLDFAAPKRAPLHLWQTPNADLAFPPDGIFGNQGPLIES
jgi:hypothetical protein